MTPPFDQDLAADEPGREAVGGPIRPRAAPMFAPWSGRPEISAGVAAGAAAVLWLVAPFLRWAVYVPDVIDRDVTGWRDATGGLGDGWIVAGLAAMAAVIAERCITGRAGPGTRPLLWVASLGAVTLVAATWWQLGEAAAELSRVTGETVVIRPGWGLLAVLAGALAAALAGRLHETDPDHPLRPDRRRSRGAARLLRSSPSGAVSSVG
ncbi:MAG TPA: hypothetical protein VK866_18740 [Acidimicrobiales bacterium]|nr:hypothetical protein [Acidimicrobiales bacterium]